MGMGGNELPKDTPQLMKYVDILVTDQNQSLTLNLNTMEKNNFIYSSHCENCTTPNNFTHDNF